jgi:AcrR family transcriptional regulator
VNDGTYSASRDQSAQSAAGRAAQPEGDLPRPRQKRLRANERRHELLKAARRAFAKNGDIPSTTMKAISREAGVSEGIIYRHFVSKDQLFLEAVVEPLNETIMRAIRGSARPARTIGERVEGTVPFLSALIDDLTEALPLIGLVLFGDPAKGRAFYKQTLSKSVDELGTTWTNYYADQGIDFPGALAARAVIGMAMMFAMESRFNPRGPKAREVAETLAPMIYGGLFPRRAGDGYVFDWVAPPAGDSQPDSAAPVRRRAARKHSPSS